MFRCTREDGGSGHWQDLPIWMFDQMSCAPMRLDARPSVDISVLSALAALLREVATGAESSNARLSGAARVSHDQNRGDNTARIAALGNTAPEIYMNSVDPFLDLGEALDIDLMDFLNFIMRSTVARDHYSSARVPQGVISHMK